MQRNYGLGLTNLIHPVTKEFNHEAVIERRGGRHPHEVLGNTKDIGMHTVLGKVHGLVVGAAAEENWKNIGGKDFDTYDMSSFFYGFIISLQDGFAGDTASNCFYSFFGVVEQLDFMVKEF